MQVQTTATPRSSAGLSQFLSRTAGLPITPIAPSAPRKSAPVVPCWVIRLAQRADCGPVHEMDDAAPLVFEACSALMLQCWRSGLRARPVRGGHFEIAVRLGPGQSDGTAIQSMLSMLHLWNQRLRDSHWQFVLEG